MLQQRFSAQLLVGSPARDPVSATRRLLAVQAQDARAARLAIRARTDGLTAAAVDRALTQERSLVVSWLGRGTLHLVCSEDYPWLHALTTPPLFTANARRLAQEGVSRSAAERGVATIERSLAEEGPLTRAQLGERIVLAGVRTQGQALIHTLMLACLRGLTVRGPVIGRQHAYVLVRDWLGESKPVDRNLALAELARRYLAGHGPADDRDLAKWAGLPLRDVRAGLNAISAELHTDADGLLSLTRRGRSARGSRLSATGAPLPPPRLLGPFDPLLMGWRSRAWILHAHEPRIVSGGLIGAIALVDGRAAATWKLQSGAVALAPFGPIARDELDALQADARDLERYLARARGA